METNLISAFYSLLQSGLWEKDVQFLRFSPIDFSKLYALAKEQAVVGLIATGLGHVSDMRIQKKDVIPFIGQTVQIEKRNKAMNHFIGKLVESLRNSGIYTLLVKGQGVAQCYERPELRSCGDVDLYLDVSRFQNAKTYFRPIVSSFDPDDDYAQHINMHYDSWTIEIHANQYCGLSRRIDKELDIIHKDLFVNGNIQVWDNDGIATFIPSPNNHVIIVFTHFLKHFYKGGLGVRQICDWCRMLWAYSGFIDVKSLENRLEKMRLMSEWKAFASYAVEYLGTPCEVIPFYSTEKKWKTKADAISSYIIEVGNFGCNRDTRYYNKYPWLLRKSISLFRRCGDLLRHASIFPMDSFRFFFGIALTGFRYAVHGE